MTKEIGLIIKMPTEQTSPEEIEERKSNVAKLLNKWVMEAFIKEKGMEDMFEGGVYLRLLKCNKPVCVSEWV